MALIRLLADPEDDTIPPPPPMLPGAPFPIENLLLDLRDERKRAKRREAGFLSVIFHLMVVVLLLLSPKIFHTAPVRLASPQQDLEKNQLTYLELPKDLITKKPPVVPKALSDRDRHFDHPTPKITDSLSVPMPRPDRRPTPATPPPGPRTTTPPAPVTQPTPPAPQPAPPAAAKPAPSSSASGLKLEDVPAPIKPKLNLNIGTLGEMDRAMAQAAHDRTQTQGAVTESAPLPPPPSGSGSNAPGQTGAGVQILTDTQGVNFDPYLRRVIEIVRANWYAVMPVTVYLGTQGRVVIVFNINSNGSVPGLNITGRSGTASLDEAAGAAISASNPFPPLPSQFHGPFITLQFSFYYNLTPPGH